MSEQVTAQTVYESLQLARQLLHPIELMGRNMVGEQAGSELYPFVTPALTDYVTQARESVDEALTELEDAQDDDETGGGALEPGTMPSNLLAPNPRGRIG